MARAAWQNRTGGAALALLVQTLFLWALLFATVQHSVRTSGRETILILHPTPPASPSTIDARGEVGVHPVPRSVASVPFSPLPRSIPQADLRAFGQALFDCAPEKYALLSLEDRKHCPKPGEGLALNPPLVLPGEERSHVRDNARWANALAHKQSPILLPGGILFPLATLGAVLDGSIAERSSAFRDPEQWGTYKDSGQPPRALDGGRGYEAWRKDSSQVIYQQPGRH